MPFRELSLTALSLAVAAVPEGLPVIVTVALSLGVSRMARRGALVLVVAGSIMLQLWSQHSDSFAGLLKTPTVSWSQSALLLMFGAAPLLVLELAKLVRRRQSRV
jgi:magnesium-transporting ATPase (P-type)